MLPLLFFLLASAFTLGCSQAPADGLDAAADTRNSPADASADSHIDRGPGDSSVDPGADIVEADTTIAAADSGIGAASRRMRVVAANLSSGNLQNYNGGEGARILQGLNPDVVLIQEFNVGDNQPADISLWVQETFEAGFHFVRDRPSKNIPNGVISRWPIIESGAWDDPETNDRELVWARIDVPGGRDLWAVSLHLKTRTSGTRDREGAVLVQHVQAQVPNADLLVVGGDLNTDQRDENVLSTLAAIVDTAAPYPVDQQNNDRTSAPRTRPYDWVLADPDLDALETPVTIGALAFEHGLVVDTRLYQPLEELAPARLDDSGADGMQHMAVVRDFLLPVGD